MIKKQRIKTALKKQFPQLSQAHIKELLQNKQVKLNGRVARFHSWVGEEDLLEVPGDELETALIPNSQLNCRLLKKTTDYIFFHKPSGLHSVAHHFKERETAANWLLAVEPDLAYVTKPLESGLVHRLDKETSGVMVAACSSQSFDHLKDLFQKQQVVKEYVCRTHLQPPKAGLYQAYATNKNGGQPTIHIQKEAVIDRHFKQLETQILKTQQLNESLFEVRLRLISGFRHQIRAHMALLGAPLLGDDLYGGAGAKRLLLHAAKLRFQDRFGKVLEILDEDSGF